MAVEQQNLRETSVVLQRVFLPLITLKAEAEGNSETLWQVEQCNYLLAHCKRAWSNEVIVQVTDTTEQAEVELAKPENFTTWEDEYNFWLHKLTELSAQKPSGTSVQKEKSAVSGGATKELNWQIRQAYFTVKQLILLRYPTQVFDGKKWLPRADLWIASLVGSLKAVVLQPPSKSALLLDTGFADLISKHSQYLAKWAATTSSPAAFQNSDIDVICKALQCWENRWTSSKLEVVDRLTEQEFAAVFKSTRHVQSCISEVQSLMRESQALRELITQMDDYFISAKLLAVIEERLDRRIATMKTDLLLVENTENFEAFVQDYRNSQAATINLLQDTIRQTLDLKTSMESLKLLRRIRKTVGGRSMDEFLEKVEEEQLYRMSLEFNRIRQGFDLTDYLDRDGLLAGRVDMAQRLFERRLLFHRVKLSLLSAFPKLPDWDYSPSTIKIKEQYVELSRYLKSTEDKLHHQWFQQIQNRAAVAISKPILRKTTSANGNPVYTPTLHQALTSIWDETRLFLEIHFQVPQICHMLLMQKPGLLNHSRSMTFILERLTLSVQQLEPFEFGVLSGEYAMLEQALNIAASHITWSSLCLEQYIRDLFESVERFQWMARDVRRISKILERRIAAILEHRLLRVSSLSGSFGHDFFGDLRRSSDNFFDEMRRLIVELPAVLLQVETLICNTQTGTAPELQDYYDYWRRRILETLLNSLKIQFEDLSNILEHGPSLFSIQVSLNDKQVVVEPNLEYIRNNVTEVVRHWIGQSCRLPQWNEGSCIPQSHTADGEESESARLLQQDPMLCGCSQRIYEQTDTLLKKLASHIQAWDVCTELWDADKVAACQKFKESSPSLSQYDEQLQYYRNYWTGRLQSMEHSIVVACVTVNLLKLKEAAFWNAGEWVRRTAAVWMSTTEEKLARLEQLLKDFKSCVEQSIPRDEDTYIDVEILMTDIRESWSRLQSHNIQVPATTQNRLKDIHQMARRLLPQIT